MSTSMYERFTDSARMAMQVANQEAKRLNHEYVCAEHLLVGLLKYDNEAGYLLRSLKVDTERMMSDCRSRIQAGPEGLTMVEPFENAIVEARKLGHNFVSTVHLLLSLLCEELSSTQSKSCPLSGITRDAVLGAMARMSGDSIYAAENGGAQRQANSMLVGFSLSRQSAHEAALEWARKLAGVPLDQITLVDAFLAVEKWQRDMPQQRDAMHVWQIDIEPSKEAAK